jgi:hypothetical protein
MRLLRMKPNSPGLMVAAFGYAGLPPSDGLIVSRLFGVSYLMVGGIGGLVRIAYHAPGRRQRVCRHAPLRVTAEAQVRVASQ